MKIAIIDDEQYWRDTLLQKCKNILAETELSSEIHVFSDGASFLKHSDYDIVFLDIEMDSENGLKLAENYRSLHGNAIIIFITSHNEFSRQGYYVDAFRYIIKENLDYELPEALHSAICKLSLFCNIRLHLLNIGDTTIEINQIYYIETEKRNIRIHFAHDSFLASDNISEVSEQLLPYHFYRTHKSFIINMEKVRYFDSENIYFTNNETAMLSTRNYSDFKKKYFQYKLELANK